MAALWQGFRIWGARRDWGAEAARARLPDVVELPVEDAHGARRRLVLEAAPVADGGVVHQRLLQLRQVYPPTEASAAKEIDRLLGELRSRSAM